MSWKISKLQTPSTREISGGKTKGEPHFSCGRSAAKRRKKVAPELLSRGNWLISRLRVKCPVRDILPVMAAQAGQAGHPGSVQFHRFPKVNQCVKSSEP